MMILDKKEIDGLLLKEKKIRRKKRRRIKKRINYKILLFISIKKIYTK